LLDVEESAPNRRSNSTIRAACAAITPPSSEFAARSSALTPRSSMTSILSSSTEEAGDAGDSDTPP
jgi:hypothetical protein